MFRPVFLFLCLLSLFTLIFYLVFVFVTFFKCLNSSLFCSQLLSFSLLVLFLASSYFILSFIFCVVYLLSFSHLSSLSFTLIISFHQYLVFQMVSLLYVFEKKNVCIYLPYACFIVHPSHSRGFGHPDKMWRRAQVMKLFDTQFSPGFCCFVTFIACLFYAFSYGSF